MTLSITRVVNACALLQFGQDAVLTDPYFERRWFLRLKEPIGLSAEQLPRLSAILGGHGAFDHWQPGSLKSYPYGKETLIIVATRRMATKSIASGLRRVEVLDWYATRQLSSRLGLEVAPAQSFLGAKSNSYVLTSRELRVFVGTEACDLHSLRRYRDMRPAVDVALLPIDGSTFLGRPLVMTAREAIEGARILGAKTLIPIHYAVKAVTPILRTPSSIGDLVGLAAEASDLDIVPLEPGKRWHLTRRVTPCVSAGQTT